MPAIGNAGLKMVMHVLGTKVIPVPSLLLTGIGSIKGIKKYEIPFKDLLKNTLILLREANEKIIVYVGYLGDAEQINSIRDCLQEFGSIIDFVVVDPVCGDHGRAYVSSEIIANWGELIAVSDLCLPNITEVALLTGNISEFDIEQSERYIRAFTSKFENTRLLVTSVDEGQHLTNKLLEKSALYESNHEKVPKNYGGSGDAFASYLIDFHFFQKMPLSRAMEHAGEMVRKDIIFSMEKSEPFLMLRGKSSI